MGERELPNPFTRVVDNHPVAQLYFCFQMHQDSDGQKEAGLQDG